MFDFMFNPLFDCDNDGIVDDMELGLGFMMIDEIEKKTRQEELESDLFCSDINPYELKNMCSDDRDDLLIENGLDPDDFYDFDFDEY